MKTLLLVAIALVAAPLSAQPSNPAVRKLNPPTLSKPTGYTHIVIAAGGRTIYIAGQVGLDKDGKIAGPDFAAQARQVFENLKAALAAGGATFDDVVKLNYYITDMANAPVLRETRGQYVTGTPPASTLVEVKSLARPEFMLEVEAIAVTRK
jgi:enamine deaminase RidA (YjgF/YER057c/UK114 family)